MVVLLLLLLALLGHAFLGVALVNRIHGTGMPDRASALLTLVCFAWLAAAPIALGIHLYQIGFDPWAPSPWQTFPQATLFYVGVCCVAAVLTVVLWVRRHLLFRHPDVVRHHRSRSVELAPSQTPSQAPALEEEHEHHFLVRMPGNQILKLDLTERVIELARLPQALADLSIVHLSDTHFTGRIARGYFEEVVQRSNEIEPELVAVTGDLVDRAAYIDWIPQTLGKLRARYGVYFILGNHDLRAGAERVRRAMTDCGLIDLGGRWLEVEVRGQPVILAGNERPWIVPAADMRECPPREGGPMRIVLSHSPDQLPWARTNDVDLLLAGHTHGGQIRFPLIGPIFAPSSQGVRYASGVFHEPPTVMHVTRGVSGELPVRLNCPPEMAHLTLHGGAEAG